MTQTMLSEQAAVKQYHSSSDNSQTSESEDNAILSTESGDENIMETFSANSINEDNQSSIDERPLFCLHV
jgi:predicted transcriptional regulator